jgi:hypothetical protein
VAALRIAARLSALLSSMLTSARNSRWGPLLSALEMVMMNILQGWPSWDSKSTGKRRGVSHQIS